MWWTIFPCPSCCCNIVHYLSLEAQTGDSSPVSALVRYATMSAIAAPLEPSGQQCNAAVQHTFKFSPRGFLICKEWTPLKAECRWSNFLEKSRPGDTREPRIKKGILGVLILISSRHPCHKIELEEIDPPYLMVLCVLPKLDDILSFHLYA